MAQFARPDSDVSTGSWSSTEVSFFDAVNESSPNDDTDYVSTSTDEDELILTLTDVTDPTSSSEHILQFVAKASGSGAKEKAEMHLFQGSTLIASTGALNIDRDSYQNIVYILSVAEADSITDYTNLILRMHVHVIGGGEEVRVTQMEFQIPDVSVSSGVESHPNHLIAHSL